VVEVVDDDDDDDDDDEAAAATIACFLLPNPSCCRCTNHGLDFQQLPLSFLQGVGRSACGSVEEIIQFKAPAISARYPHPHPHPHPLSLSLSLQYNKKRLLHVMAVCPKFKPATKGNVP
jgi:hypothetical protein